MSGMESIRRESSRLSRSSNKSFTSHGKGATVGSGSHTGPSGRPSLLSKAYNSVSHRGAKLSHRNSGLYQAKSATSEDGDVNRAKGKDLVDFSGIFETPEPSCQPKAAAKLTEEQEKRYSEMLSYFQQLADYPCSLKAEEKERRPASDWEKLRYLSRESLLRYLRATKWDAKAAEKRLTDTIAWHREFGTEQLKADEMAKEAKSGKETVLGFDNSSRPLHYMHPHRNDTKESPRQMQYAVWILERCIDMMPPGVEQLALLINFEHRSRNPTSIANAKLMLYILQNHYVERLGIALCINVPWVFKMFWNAIQAFIDPVTKSKCRFDEAVKSEVPLNQLSSDFGGNLDATYNHDAYWPELVRTTDERREEMLRRFKQDCKGEIGASEWVIRGGDDPTSPFYVGKKVAQETDADTEKTKVEGPNSIQRRDTGTIGSHGTSTDTSSASAPVPELRDSTPLEQFKTPSSTIRSNPLERTFSTATSAGLENQSAGVAALSLETTKEKPKEEEEEDQTTARKLDAVGVDDVAETTTAKMSSTSKKQHSNNVFKEMDRKLHASKLFAAFHPDTKRDSQDHGRRKQPSRTPTEESDLTTEGEAQASTSIIGEALENVPSAHEIVAVAGASGPSAAAGAITSLVAEQARSSVQRVRTTAANNLAVLTTVNGEDVKEKESDGQEQKIVVRLVNVLFFAAAKDAVGGRGKHQMALPTSVDSIALSEFRDHMLKAFDEDKPSDNYDGIALRSIVAQSRWSVDEDMVEDDDLKNVRLFGGEDVAIIPPVSGG